MSLLRPASAFFEPAWHRSAARFAEIIAVVALAHVAAVLFWTLATGPYRDSAPPPGDAAAWNYPPVATDAHSVLAAFDPFYRDAPERRQAAMSAPPTDLDMKLFGTRMGMGGTGSSAILRLPDYNHTVLSPGDLISPGVTLAEVHARHVVLTRNGRRETLYLDSTQMQSPSSEAPTERVSFAAAAQEPVSVAVRDGDENPTGLEP